MSKKHLFLLLSITSLCSSLYALPAVLDGPIVNPANGNSYYLLGIGSWTDSQERAVQLGGNLATINDQSENEWVCTEFDSALVNSGAKGFWIGINDVAQEGDFVWASGESVTYTNWAPSQPSHEDYGHIWGSTAVGREICKWNDISNFRNDFPMQGVVEVDIEKVPVSLEIIGLDSVMEQSENYYSVIVEFEDGSTREVTWLSEWLVTPVAVGSINQSGLLETHDIDISQEILLEAGYTSLGITVSAEKTVFVEMICRTGTALEFDGQNDYVAAGSIPPIGVNDSFVWAFWVKLSSNNSQYAVILGNQPGTTTSTHFFKFSPTFFEYVNFGYDGLINYNIPTGVWNYLSVVKEGNQLTYYSNGEVVGSDSVHKDMPENLLRFGGDPLLGMDFAHCQIDEVSIWNIALTQEQIKENMNRRLLGSESGLIGYWDFDEGEGQVVNDLSGHGRNGALGSNPEEEDNRDPVWVKSDAPVEGICDPLSVITRTVEQIIAQKINILDQLESVLSQESAVMDLLGSLSSNPDNVIPKQQLLQSKQKIFISTVREEHSYDDIVDSIDWLDASLEILLGKE